MTINEAIREGTERLVAAQVPDARYDAETLMEYVADMARFQLLTKLDEELTGERCDRFFECIEKRSHRVPLQHITGVQEFMGLPIHVDERVLCPRLDTETLAMEVDSIVDSIYRRGGLKDVPGNVVPLRHDIYFDREFRLLDMCTGSGCVAISAASHAKTRGYDLNVTAVDASADALTVARENAARIGVEIEFLHGDLYEPVSGKRFHVITANPPYIPSRYIPELMPEVRDYEPHMALDGGDDGLDYYHRITEAAPDYLEPGGWLLYEIGYDQGEDVRDIMDKAGFSDVTVIKDLAGDDRVVRGHL